MRMFFTDCRQMGPTRSFFSSPKIRVYPQPVSVAINTTSSRMIAVNRGRPFRVGFDLPSSLRTQRRNVE